MSANPIPRKSLKWRLTIQERKLILFCGDLFIAILALVIAIYFWAQPDWLRFSWAFVQERIPFWFFGLPLLWLLLITELYEPRKTGRIAEVIKGISLASAVLLGLYLILYFTFEPNSLPRRGVAVFIGGTFVLTLLWRVIYIQVFSAPHFLRRVLIVGAGRTGALLTQMISEIWPPPFVLVGFVDDDPSKKDLEICGYKVIGNSENLARLVHELDITNLILSIGNEIQSSTYQCLLDMQLQGIEITTMASVYEELFGRVPIMVHKSDWVLRTFVDQASTSTFYSLVKRVMDLIGASVGLLILGLLFPFIAIAILASSGGPVIYSQNRLGRNGKVFKIYKFRTMIKDAEKDGKPKAAEENDARITKIGKLLRKSHLDELPQFYNILRGEMSLVGPRAERPELEQDLHEAIPFYRARLLVKPGASGWAQVNFGYASTIEASTIKLEYDLYYIKHQNLLLDISVMIRTAGTMLGFKGR